MYNVQRTATIRAMSSCRLWKMDRFIYLDLLLRDAKAQRQRLVDFVKEQKVFSGLTAEQAAGVAELLQPVVLPAAAEYAGTQWSALAGSGTEAAAGATSAATADAIFFVERGELTLHRDGYDDATTLKRGDAFGAAEAHLAALLSRWDMQGWLSGGPQLRWSAVTAAMKQPANRNLKITSGSTCTPQVDRKNRRTGVKTPNFFSELACLASQ